MDQLTIKSIHPLAGFVLVEPLLREWWRPRTGDHAYFEGRYKVMIEADSPFVGTSGVKYYPLLSGLTTNQWFR